MDLYLKIPLNLLLVAGGIAMWILTPWSVWSAATVTAGLGVLSLGSYISYAFIGGSAILVIVGYVVQPDVVSLIGVFKL